MALVGILHLMNGFKNASIGQIVKHLIQSLEDQDYQWVVGGLSNQGEMHADYTGLRACVVDFSHPSGSTRASVQQIQQFLAQNPIQIIHTHTIRTLLVAWMALFSSSSSAGARIVHVSTKHTLTAPRDRRWGTLISPIDHLALYLPDYLVPVSHIMERKILTQPWINHKQVVTIPNAIPCDEWYHPERRKEFRERYRFSTETIVIGFGGRFEPVKRLDLLIQAIKDLTENCPNIHLALAGEGSLRPQLENQIAQLDISSQVTWIGFCQDMPGFLSAIDFYVQPSANEGLPLSILEAMAAQKPVIATRVGGTSEVINDGVNGILIPPLSVEAIHHALLSLILDPEKSYQIAQNARQTVRADYSLERMASGYHRLYQRILARNLELSGHTQSTSMVR